MKRRINEFYEKAKMIKEFRKEHRLPSYSPKGQYLEWDISAEKTGPYDIYTGEQTGERKIIVMQKRPRGGIMCDDTVYMYDIETKQLIETSGRWR